MPIAHLDRSVLRLSGDGVVAWLDKLVTNSLDAPLSFAGLLTPQGKIIADFFVTRIDDDLIIDTAPKFAGALLKRLKMYRLRAPIEITEETAFNVFAIWDGEGDEGHLDPRHGTLGRRVLTRDTLETTGDYNAHRLSLGVVESQYDFDTAQMFPADVNMDLMNGVDFKKGCFIGQEVVSRMKRMTTVKKRARGLLFDRAGVPPQAKAKAGDPIEAGTRVIGDVLSVQAGERDIGMGLIRLDRWHSSETNPTVNGAPISIMGGVDGSR